MPCVNIWERKQLCHKLCQVGLHIELSVHFAVFFFLKNSHYMLHNPLARKSVIFSSTSDLCRTFVICITLSHTGPQHNKSQCTHAIWHKVKYINIRRRHETSRPISTDHLSMYSNFHYEGKTVVTYLYNGKSYTGINTSWYWNAPNVT